MNAFHPALVARVLLHPSLGWAVVFAFRVLRPGLASINVAVAAQAGGADASGFPLHSRDTGLYVAGSMTQVRSANLPFAPQYPLWSDGAAKRRWLPLPPGKSIDASSPDAWECPPGTKLWKESAHGRAIETRYIERRADGSWHYAAYVWNEDGCDALLAPAAGTASLPVNDAPQGRCEVPSRADCRACHEGAAVPVLGFSALQLSQSRDPNAAHAPPAEAAGVDLRRLVERGLLRHLPLALLEHPPQIAADGAAQRGQAKPTPAKAGADQVARGKYLVSTSGCHDCHTPFKMGANGPEPDMSRMLSGHPEQLAMPPVPQLPEGPWLVVSSATNTAWAGPWGVSFTANLTPDADTGLGEWSAQNFKDTIRTGRHMGRGRPVLPPMPIPVYQNFTDRDLEAIYSYLRTIPAVKNKVPEPWALTAAAASVQK